MTPEQELFEAKVLYFLRNYEMRNYETRSPLNRRPFTAQVDNPAEAIAYLRTPSCLGIYCIFGKAFSKTAISTEQGVLDFYSSTLPQLPEGVAP